MKRRYALQDDQWERIKDLLPGRKETVGVTAKKMDCLSKWYCHCYRAGLPWRDLPERFGDFSLVHTRLSRWAKRGMWQEVFEVLAEDADNEYAMIDSTIVRLTKTLPGRLVAGVRHLFFILPSLPRSQMGFIQVVHECVDA